MIDFSPLPKRGSILERSFSDMPKGELLDTIDNVKRVACKTSTRKVASWNCEIETKNTIKQYRVKFFDIRNTHVTGASSSFGFTLNNGTCVLTKIGRGDGLGLTCK